MSIQRLEVERRMLKVDQFWVDISIEDYKMANEASFCVVGPYLFYE